MATRKLVSAGTPQIFHYTSVESFASIFETKQFWATHYSDMNDTSEQQAVDHFVPLLADIFKERAANDMAFSRRLSEGGGLGPVCRREAEMHVSQIHKSIFRDFEGPFIVSFCGHDHGSYEATNGLLSQWRGYGSSGGVAIVLDKASIATLMSEERDLFAHALNRVGNVRYDHDASGIRSDFSDFFDQASNILRDFYGSVQPRYERIFDAFVGGTTLVKHRAFHEERETRIVVCPRTKNPASPFYDSNNSGKPAKEAKYRKRFEGEARYIELFGRKRLPIDRVIVGPSRVQRVNQQRVAEIVGDSGIPVALSEIPYVG